MYFVCVHSTTVVSFLHVTWFLLAGGSQEHQFQDNLVVWVGPWIPDVLLHPCGCGSQRVFWWQVLGLHANVTVTHGLTYNAAVCVDHAADEVTGGCHHRLNSARLHTDLGKGGPQNGVDPASAIENKPWSKDQRQTAWTLKPGSCLGWLRMCWAVHVRPRVSLQGGGEVVFFPAFEAELT